MKLKHVGMIVVSVLAMSSAAVSAAEGDESVTTTVNGGVIHFKGEVVNAACAIDSESMNQTVELGQVRSSRLAKAGDLSSAVGFNIKLNDCGSKLTLINPTPYFITVTNMKAGNSNLPNTMVPPKGEVSVDITHAATGDISFQTINDYGALTPRIKATMQ
ncbi:TPA: fimbrial protein [Escherichia coli]